MFGLEKKILAGSTALYFLKIFMIAAYRATGINISLSTPRGAAFDLGEIEIAVKVNIFLTARAIGLKLPK